MLKTKTLEDREIEFITAAQSTYIPPDVLALIKENPREKLVKEENCLYFKPYYLE